MSQEKPLGRYTIVSELGRGPIGAVYEATDRTTGAVVALKVLDPGLFADRNSPLAAAFLKNARSAARLRHRNIVGILDAGEAGGTAYVAMELVDGESLRRLLDQRPLPLARAVRIFDDIASALAYAHEEGMPHRGVKPSNIMVLRSGLAKIGDFGTGQIGEAALRYTSPEQMRKEPLDHRSDLFSLGVVFYEMLTRRVPFDGKSPEQVRERILRAQPPQPPSKLNPQVPVALDALVLKMLDARPDDRFADFRILLRDLQRLGLRPGPTIDPASVPPARPAPIARAEPPPRVEPAAPPPLAPEPEPALMIPEPQPGDAFDHRRAMLMMDREAERQRASAPRPGLLAPLALILAVTAIGLTGYMYYSLGFVDSPAPPPAPAPVAQAPKEPPAATGAWQNASTPEPMQQKTVATNTPRPITPPPAAAPIKEPAPAPAASDEQTKKEPPGTLLGLKPPPSNPLAAVPVPPPPAEAPVARAPEQPAPPRAAPVARPAPVKAPPRAKPAQLILTVSPGGDVYINDERKGTTPETTTFDLEPGMHRIEVRSGSRKPFLTYMTVEPGEVRRIRHDFDAKPSRPPT